jgi:hypothetical protein
MRLLVREKEKAIELRKKGLSYRDILAILPVAKSTLSEWLKDLPLTNDERKYLKTRIDSNISRGRIKAASAHRVNRLEREKLAQKEAQKEFEKFASDRFFLVGIALYWAEGTKRSSGFEFVNSDSEMVGFMVLWVEKFFNISRQQQKIRLFIHKPYAHEHLEKKWSSLLGIPLQNFQKTIYKSTGLLIKKRPGYIGCVRLEIGRMHLMRKMQYWQNQLFALFCKRGTLS